MSGLVPVSPASSAAAIVGADALAGYLAAARSAATRAAYGADWAHFDTWCRASGVAALPAAPETVAAYLAASAGRLAVSTLTRRATTINVAHRALGLPSPTRSPLVVDTLAGIRRVHRSESARKDALWTDQLARLLDPIPADTLLGARDSALLLLGFAAALRRGELVALDVADVREDRHGLVVHIARSKTDPEGSGAEVGVPYGRRTDLCPVLAVLGWRSALAAAAGVPADQLAGPLFRPVDRRGKLGSLGRVRAGVDARLTAKAVWLIVRRRAEAAGLDPTSYGAHSLRSGFATVAAAGGATEQQIMEHGRWRSATVARRYVRRGSLFTDNPAARLGL